MTAQERIEQAHDLMDELELSVSDVKLSRYMVEVLWEEAESTSPRETRIRALSNVCFERICTESEKLSDLFYKLFDILYAK